MAEDLFSSEFAEHAAVLEKTRGQLAEPFARLVAEACRCLADGGKLLFCGNGGSAADAQHLAAELVSRYKAERRGLPAIALTTDSSILTAIGNDYSFDRVFARQVEALARPGDMVIGISTSGNSPNILAALEAARKQGAVAAGLTGRDGGRMVGLADPLLIVPSPNTPRIQEMHILLGHALCDAIERSVV